MEKPTTGIKKQIRIVEVTFSQGFQLKTMVVYGLLGLVRIFLDMGM